MMKMLNSLLSGVDGSDPANSGGLPFSPDDISKATGLPPFLTNIFMGQGKAPPTAADEQTARIWTLVHVVLSLLAGIYVVYVLSSSTKLFGSSPPAPATLKNPFLIFITGELLVHTTQMFLVDRAGPKGMWAWWQILKDIARDGSIVVFMMGAASWLSIY
jgi:GET complex subunit GET2